MWLFFVILGIVSFYVFLVSPKLIGRNSLKGYGRYFAHRGLHRVNTPENSLEAFMNAVEKGYGIELDVLLTKDNVPVVFHDYSLERMCGIKGDIKDFTFEMLSSLSLSGTSHRILALDEVLSVIGGKALVLVELKTVWEYVNFCERVGEVLKRHEGKYIIQSFNPFMLKWFRKNMPEIPRGQLISRHLLSGGFARSTAAIILASLTLNFASRPDFISIHYSQVKSYTYYLPKLFLSPFAFWTVKDGATAEKLKRKAKIIIFEGFEP